MIKRYVLSDLLKELEQDDADSRPHAGGKLSQADIRERIAAKRKKAAAPGTPSAPASGEDTEGGSR